jgi:DNA-binding beta-propeller fold protein YncE
MLVRPQGLFVNTSTHDLYVANSGGGDILVFHRGQMHPYNIYTDPSGEATSDVTVAKDGTVIACNIGQPHNPLGGSISTWIEGPNGGKFVGTFPMPDATQGEFITVQKDGTVYYNAFSGEHGRPTGALWTVRCPAGLCGTQTQVFGVGFQFPGGLRSDENDDLLTVDQVLVLAERFELPNLTRRFYPLAGAVVPVGMAFNHLDHHWFIADARNNDVAEYLYPSFALVGTVPGNAGGIAIDVAVDPAR